jgi:hypothetical protein
MSDAKRGGDTPWKIPLSEIFILLGFVLLVSAAIVTVVVPELQDEPETERSGSVVEDDQDSNRTKKP